MEAPIGLCTVNRYSRGGPAHEGILPALTIIELDLPCVDVVGATLHGILGRHMDAHATLLQLLLRYAGEGADIDCNWYRYLAAQLVALFQILGPRQSCARIQWGNVRGCPACCRAGEGRRRNRFKHTLPVLLLLQLYILLHGGRSAAQQHLTN